MAKLKRFKPDNIQERRKSSRLSQVAFWARFGVAQTTGSRYESGNSIPLPTSMLIWLHEAGRIDDRDLDDALKAVKAAN